MSNPDLTSRRPSSHRIAPLAPGRAGVAVALALVMSAFATAQSFDPKDFEWTPKENQELEIKWARPKHPKWRSETIDVGDSRKLIDVLVRAESPSAQPDMIMRIFAWSHEGSFKPVDYPSKSNDDVKSIISKDEVLKQDAHKEFGNSLVQMFAVEDENKISQRDILDKLVTYRKNKSNNVKSFGKELEAIVDLHEKKKYIVEVPLQQGSAGELIKFYNTAAHYDLDRAKVGGIENFKLGKKPFSAKTFSATGMHRGYKANVMIEYYVFGGLPQHTGVVEIIYFGGVEKNDEIRWVKNYILGSFDKM